MNTQSHRDTQAMGDTILFAIVTAEIWEKNL